MTVVTCPLPGESQTRAPLAPFRGDVFSAEHLDSHFITLANSLSIANSVPSQDRDFSARFDDNAEEIATAHGIISLAARGGEFVPAEAEWLLDNFYVVEEQLREIRDDLPRGFYRELPKTAAGHPRVFELARELVIHTDSSLDEVMVERCVQQFQTVASLSIGEVWAVPIMLRLVLVENLRRLCDQMLLTYHCRHSAREMVDSWRPEAAFLLAADSEPQCIPTIIQLLEQLPERGAAHRPAITGLERQIAERGWILAELVRQEHQRQAANQVSIGNVITSMRLIASLDWIAYFEQVNHAEQMLRQDPACVYEQMHFESRDQYRHVVEELAKRTKLTDVRVAEKAIACARSAQVASGEDICRTHVGYWLIAEGRRELEREIGYRPPLHRMVRHAMLQWPDLTYFGLLSGLTTLGLVVIVVFCVWLHVPPWVAAVLLLCWLLPASELAQSAANLLITNLLPPRLLPRFDFKAGVPLKYPTIVVVPSMLSSASEVDSLLSRLESHYLSNSDDALLFALLTDFTDAPKEATSQDGALLDRAIAGIRRLNRRYQQTERQPFYLFHRRRQWNASEGTWMGWERKRGKLMEFGRLLQGEGETSYDVQEGDLTALEKFRHTEFTPFIITLDSDTQLPHDSARKLIGTLAHPLNRPQFSADHAAVTSGYSILQPRVNVHLASAGRSWFAKLFAGTPGVDPYATAVSDVYQDLFGEGSFTGKGIYDLQAFERALAGAFPENAILSHDLIEGCHARVGLVSNIEVYDGYPARYDAEARRAHRWVRGDWQLLPWLLPFVPYATGWKRNPLSILSRWKVFDNLRRSIVPPALLIGLLFGWCVTPQGAAWWTLAAGFVLAFPLFSQLSLVVRNWPWKLHFAEHARAIAPDLLKTLMQSVLATAVLPHRAWSMIDAIACTMIRMLITRRHLLEWETAAAVEWRVSNSRWSLPLQMRFVPALAIAALVLLPWPAKLAALPFAILWLIAPAIVYFISQPIKVERSKCNATQVAWLREITSQTWAFFEAYVGPRDHWLPVDNVQEEPQEKIAHRLSPTNEGLYLLSALIARDFGYLGLNGLATTWESNLGSLQRLEMLHGHFYNWYDTETLQPLHPRYVSTVDSGNLAACLLTMHAGAQELLREPVLRPELIGGLTDSLDLLKQACERVSEDDPKAIRNLAKGLCVAADEFLLSIPPQTTDPASWQSLLLQVEQFITLLPADFKADEIPDQSRGLYQKLRVVRGRLQGLSDDVRTLLPWLPVIAEHSIGATAATWSELAALLSEAQSLQHLTALEETTAQAIDRLRASNDVAAHQQQVKAISVAIQSGSQAAKALIGRFDELALVAESLALGMDFRFLFNPQRRLFAIGYNVEEGRPDRSHYDMLCSEARLASFLAIAKGDVEAAHWFRLGRHATISAGKFTLLSWGGTMFEYLMPPLFQRQYEGSLLTQSCQAAVLRQQEHGRQHKIPWGVSESAFGALAINSDYHYRSFGVPGLGLKRGLAKDLVVSPYSTLMALTIDPVAAVNNLHGLEAEGALGEFGFYDALDYTPERVPFGNRRIVVRCYMAHHQGMGLLALANVLHGGSIQRRFNAHPLARAAELLLQERVPTVMTPFEPHADEVEPYAAPHEEQQLTSRRLVGIENANPRTQLLSNGRYSVMLTSAGGGFSRSGPLDVTRWRSDSTLDSWGQFIYIRELDTDQVWSPTYQPTCVAPDGYEVIFAIDKVDFHRHQGELETLLEVAVSPENNAEVRQLRITNHGHKPKRVQLTSYAEVSLATAAADLAHPAFQKLFLETEFIPEESALIARRRPRDAEQNPVYSVHVLAMPHDFTDLIEHETSRQEFLGRRRTTLEPQAIRVKQLSGTVGAVLDPIFSLRCTLQVPPGESVVIAFSTAIAATREEALALADQYHELRNVQRVFELAWAYAQVELRHQHLAPGQVHLYQRLASYLLYPHRSLRGDEALLQRNRLGQSGLWRHGISGDLPILLARVTEPEHVALVRELALAQRFWRERGFRADLVIINDYPGSYFDALQDQMVALLQEVNSAIDKPGVYLLRGAHLPAEEQALFETVAACVLHAERGPISQQLETANQLAAKMATYASPRVSAAGIKANLTGKAFAPSPEPLEFWNGYGGFAQDGKEYHICVQPNQLPPMPWSQVVANPRLGFLVTETGGGYTWFENSRENKLTSWSNDPIADQPGEVLYVQDEATGESWLPLSGSSSSLSALAGSPGSESWAHYGAGYARFLKNDPTLSQEVLLAVSKDEPVKFIRLKITNRYSQTKTFTVSYYAELVLGVCREQTHLHLQSAFDSSAKALLCRNPFHAEYPHQVAFLKVLGETSGYTTDRGQFLGRHGCWERPQALRTEMLSNRTGVGLDPCALVQTRITIRPQQTEEVIFLFGAGADEAQARSLLAQFDSPAAVETATQQNLDEWNDILETVQVRTPNRALDLLVNHWLLYQVLCCRMWARSAFYQSGGAYGFRDQLQDSLALVYSRPQLVREHLLRAAARQYRQGDVQHWWHPPLGKGTRTRFSDDLLWLPYAVSQYVRITGDQQVLDEMAPFLDSPILQPYEHERYEQPKSSNESADLYEHCLRAIDRSLKFGPHGLPLMGCGDWNDGMNRVGADGTGESVWVGWFLLVVIEDFLPLMHARQDTAKAQAYENATRDLRAALEAQAWDGQWYRRAYFDDGTPLGSAQNDECQIDSLSQTWAVFAGADPERARQGVRAATQHLVNREAGIILLFAPPFDRGELNPGYIKGYLPGIRENGGQYTHAATWLIQALAQLGETQQAMSLFDLINPILHTQSTAGVARYQTEPYVIAADVYGVPPNEGRGGWSWYTGSAAWLYRVALEQLLGLQVTKDSAALRPSIPASWVGIEVRIRRGKSHHKLCTIRDFANGLLHNSDNRSVFINRGEIASSKPIENSH